MGGHSVPRPDKDAGTLSPVACPRPSRQLKSSLSAGGGTRLDRRVRVALASNPRVLVADDQPDVIAALRLLLRGAGLDADAASSIQDVRDRLNDRAYDLLLMDLNYARDTTSGAEGLDLLTEVHARDRHLPIVVMTGWGSIDTAVEAMRRGARAFVPKPW